MKNPVEKEKIEEQVVLFESFDIDKKLQSSLRKMKYFEATPIQGKAIPQALKGNDVIGVAQTGTGKTLAFGIPTIQKLIDTKGKALILLPTRELALQVHASLSSMGFDYGMRSVALIGGIPIRFQKKDLMNRPRIIVATPGRLIDHLECRNIDLSDIKMLVLDEADRMFDMGFAPQLEQIMETIPKERQTMLFSATMPEEIVALAQDYMKLPVRIEIAAPGTTAELVDQEILIVSKERRTEVLEDILKEETGSVLVFTRTKITASILTRNLIRSGFRVAEIHSDRSQNDRQRALKGFKDGYYQVLVATDIAARGIHVNNIALVLNYDLPDNNEDYVHRIGRTGRAGKRGKAISFALPDQALMVKGIEKLIKKPIPRKQAHEGVDFESDPWSSSGRSFGRGGRGSSRGGRGGSSFRGGRSQGGSRGGFSRGRSSERNFGSRGDFAPRSESFSERPSFSRNEGSVVLGNGSEKSYRPSERPVRSERPAYDRSESPRRERSSSERTPRYDRPSNDRPAYGRSETSRAERPTRFSREDRPSSSRSSEKFSYGDRKEKSERGTSKRPAKSPYSGKRTSYKKSSR